MGKKLVMVPAHEVDLLEVEYKPEVIQGKSNCSSFAFDFFKIVVSDLLLKRKERKYSEVSVFLLHLNSSKFLVSGL